MTFAVNDEMAFSVKLSKIDSLLDIVDLLSAGDRYIRKLGDAAGDGNFPHLV